MNGTDRPSCDGRLRGPLPGVGGLLGGGWLSQVFVAFDLASVSDRDEAAAVVESIIADLGVRYPGERAVAARRQSAEEGVPVDPATWRWLQESVPHL